MLHTLKLAQHDGNPRLPVLCRSSASRWFHIKLIFEPWLGAISLQVNGLKLNGLLLFD